MYCVPSPLSAWIFVIAAVNVVFPWSTCPIVPTFTCGFVRSNLALAMSVFRCPGSVSLVCRRSVRFCRRRPSTATAFKLATGIEPVTSSLPRMRSTD